MTLKHVFHRTWHGWALRRFSSLFLRPIPRFTTTVVLMPLALTTAIGCGSKRLDRSTAEVLVSAAIKASPIPTNEIRLGERWQLYSSGEPEWAKVFVAKGLITDVALGERRVTYADTPSIYHAELTSEGTKYKVSERQATAQLIGALISHTKVCRFCSVRMAEYAFGQVTGIRESPQHDTAQVAFTWKYANVTPFGEAAGDYSTALDRTCSVTFTRYDDGWRLPQGWVLPVEHRSLSCELYD